MFSLQQTAGTPVSKVNQSPAPPKKKSRGGDKEEEGGRESTEASQLSSGSLDGFRPPAGIVHEALTNAGERSVTYTRTQSLNPCSASRFPNVGVGDHIHHVFVLIIYFQDHQFDLFLPDEQLKSV